jgi:hypothetical protein
MGQIAHHSCRRKGGGGFEGVDVGDRICVQLISINVERGFVDFKGVDKAGD